MNKISLTNNLTSTLVDINNQIAVILTKAEVDGIGGYHMQYSDGSFVMVPLLLAKAQCLNGLALIESMRAVKR